MRIAICDDEEFQRKNIVSFITPYQTDYPAMMVSEFCCGEDLLAAIGAGQSFDFFFLDIQMKEIDGIQTAQAIRKDNPHAILFFITGFMQYVSAAFTLNAFQFLVKPVKREAFDREFRRAIVKYLMDHRKYVVESKSRVITLEIKDIVYLESSKHLVIIHTGQGEYVKPGKLNDEEAVLRPYGFVRTHHGFLVNMAFVFEVLQEDIILKDGSKVMVSTRKRADVLQSYNQYLAGCAL